MTGETLELFETSADRRVKRTKKALRSALFALAEKKDINKITVREITELADINRSTFYLYYKDVFDMFESIQSEILTLLYKTVLPFEYNPNDTGSFAEYIKRFLELCRFNPEPCRFIFRNGTNNNVARLIKDKIVEFAPDSHKFFPLNDPRHHLTTFALSGMVFTVAEWVENGMSADIDDMALFLAETYVNGSKAAKNIVFPGNSVQSPVEAE